MIEDFKVLSENLLKNPDFEDDNLRDWGLLNPNIHLRKGGLPKSGVAIEEPEEVEVPSPLTTEPPQKPTAKGQCLKVAIGTFPKQSIGKVDMPQAFVYGAMVLPVNVVSDVFWEGYYKEPPAKVSANIGIIVKYTDNSHDTFIAPCRSDSIDKSKIVGMKRGVL